MLRKLTIAPDVVGQFAFFQNLQQHVPHVRVRLFDFVEEHNGVGIAAHLFGELAAFLVTDVTRRRTDQARDVELLHVFAHVELETSDLASPNICSASVLAKSVLPTPVGPSSKNVPMGRRGSFRSARERRNALQMAETASRWPMTTFSISVSMVSNRCVSSWPMRLMRNAGPLGDHVQNVFLVHHHALFLAAGAPVREHGLQFFLRLLFLVAHRGRAFKILVLDGAFLFGFDFLDLGLERLDLRRPRHRADARAGTGFIHHVNRLVRQKPVGDVTVGEFDGGFDGFVGEFGLVMLLVFAAQALQNHNRLVHRGGFDLDGLETAFQRGVLLDVFAVFVERGRADALHLAAAERGLDDVRGVHRAFRRTGADDGVQFVNEQNDVLRAADFVHDGLDALFKLAAILGARDHQREVEGDDALVAQDFRHVAAGDFLRQAFDDGRLAHARFAEQHGIVLGAAAENLDDALDFVFAADDRVHVAFAGDFREVAAKRLERGRLDFALFLRRRAPAVFRPASRNGRSSPVKFGSSSFKISCRVCSMSTSRFLSTSRGHAVAFAQQAEQNVLGADVSVIERLGLLGREREDLLHARRVGDVADHLLVGAGADLLLDLHADGFEVEAHFLEDIDGDALAQLDQAEQKMFGAEKVVVEPVGFLARQREHLLRARREIAHGFVAHTSI